MPSFDAIIIGGGLGGLTTAALLAKQGQQVCVLEKNARLGGYAVNYTSHGHRFDVATQALGGCGEGGIVQSLLSELGLADLVSFLACEPARAYHFPDSDSAFIQHGFLQEQQQFLATLYPEFESEIQACYTLFAKIFSELQAIAETDVNPVFGFSRNFPVLAKYGRMTVQEFFTELEFTPELQLRIGARSGYCMLPLGQLSLVAFACTEMSYAGGAWMVQGGVGELVKVLDEFLTANKAEIQTRCRVRHLLFDEGAVVGVETTTGEKIRSRSVVMAVDGTDILAQSGPNCQPLLTQYKKMDRTGSYLVSYYQVPSHLVEEMHANVEVRLPEQILAGSTKIDVYYLLIPSLVDRQSAPDTSHSFCISVPLKERDDPGHQERAEIRLKLEQLVFDRYPELRGKLKFLFELGPKHFQVMTGNQNGSAYGFSQTVRQSGIYRLGNNPRVSGLYLAGHWTMPGGGIAGVMTSGKLCAKAILKTIF
jgi:prolycopene isomerase